MFAFMRDFDLIVCPANGETAGPHLTRETLASIQRADVWDGHKKGAGAYCITHSTSQAGQQPWSGPGPRTPAVDHDAQKPMRLVASVPTECRPLDRGGCKLQISNCKMQIWG
jgi:hypothetical protein